MALKDAIYYKLRFNIEIPESIYNWMMDQNLDPSAYETHLKELRQGYAHYCHWREQYKFLIGIKYSRDKSRATEVADFIIKTFKDLDVNERDKEYFSVFLKIALDQVLEDHWKMVRLGY